MRQGQGGGQDRWPQVPGLTLVRHLGAGSTGTVYAARRDLDQWSCAVKVAGDLSAEQREHLMHEAAVLGSVRLPHLIALHDVLDTTDGRLALVLDLADGGHVGQLLRQRGTLTGAEAVTVLAPVLATLAELHQRGIVHGDVSATNVLLTGEGRPMLNDLGRARLVGQRPATTAATVEYLAPEVNAPGPPTAAADVYAAGALGWRLITGEPVPIGLVRRPLAEVAPDCPVPLALVIDECLRGDPAARPSARQAADEVLGACRATPLQLSEGPGPGEQLTMRLRERRGRTPQYRPTPGSPGEARWRPGESEGDSASRALALCGRHRRERLRPARGLLRAPAMSMPATRGAGTVGAAGAVGATSGWWTRAVPVISGLAAFAAVTAGVLWWGWPFAERVSASNLSAPGSSSTAVADPPGLAASATFSRWGPTSSTPTALTTAPTAAATARPSRTTDPTAHHTASTTVSATPRPTAPRAPRARPTSTSSSTPTASRSRSVPPAPRALSRPAAPTVTAATPRRPAPRPAPSQSPRAGVPPRPADQHSPAALVLAELAALADLRARALSEAEPSYLDQVYTPGSVLINADRALVDQARRDQMRCEGLRYDLLSPVVEALDDSHAVIRTRIATGRYTILTPQTRVVRPPAVEQHAVRMHLVRTPQGWRIAAMQTVQTA